MMRRYGVMLGCLVAIGPPARAQEEPVKTRSFGADFGLVSVAGNTSVTTFNVGDKLIVNTLDKKVIFTQMFNLVRSEVDGVKNAENYRAQLRLDYGLDGRIYLFGLTGWERNVPGGIARRFEETIGLAWKAVALPQDQLDLELGLSLFQQKNAQAAAGALLHDDYTAGRLAALYKHSFTSATFFTQSLELIPNLDDGDDFRLNSETAVVAPISAHVGIKLGYLIRYDNLPGLAPDPNPTEARLEKTDRFLTAGLTISY